MHRPSCLVALMLLAGCDMPGRPRLEDRYVTPHEEVSFSVLYKQNCSGCHGADGTLGPAPPLNDPIFRSIIPEKDLEKVIAEGRAGTLMPAFAEKQGGPLTEAQVKVMVTEIKGTAQSPRWGTPEGRKDAPAYIGKAPGSKDRGQKVFERACASCHGDYGQGDTSGAINDPSFLALMSDQVLRRIIITGRPDLGMPDYADPVGRDPDFKALTDQDVADLVALLKSWRTEGKK
jgi:mono/diheme cytochrome c family protein